MIKNLVFEGGGIKGLAYCGAIKYLEENDLLKNIEKVAGASAGAITAALLTFGFTADELADQIKKVNFADFLDGNVDFDFDDMGKLELSWEVAKIVYDLYEYEGICSGKKFVDWLIQMAKLKGFDETTTFRDLKEEGLKELHIIITGLSTHRSEVANYKNTPDMPVVTAIRASMSIPIAFVPVKYNDRTFVDGGTLRNFPIDIFDTYLCEDGVLFPYKIEKNMETLGLKLDTQEEIAQILKHENPKLVKIDGSIDLLENIMTTLLNQQLDVFVRSGNYKRTVFIDTGDITTLQFGLTNEQQKFLIDNGRQAMKNYFKAENTK